MKQLRLPHTVLSFPLHYHPQDSYKHGLRNMIPYACYVRDILGTHNSPTPMRNESALGFSV